MQENTPSYFYLDPQNDTMGPLSPAELEALAVQGTITADTLIASDGWAEWKPWGQIQAEENSFSLALPPGSAPEPFGDTPQAGTAVLSSAGTEVSGSTVVPTRLPAPAGVVNEEILESAFPWEVPPGLAAKVKAYNEGRNYRSHLCKCNEFLNGVIKSQTFKALKDAEAEIRIYPDVVGVDLREESQGCLMVLIALLPEPLRAVPLFVLSLALFCLNAVGGLFGFALLALSAMALLILLVFLWYVIIPGAIAAAAALLLFEGYNRRRLPIVAQRIRAEPKSPFAVRKLRKYCRTVPRYWRKDDRIGAVVQILRAETRYRLRRRSLVLVVQDNPIEKRRGWLPPGIGLRAERRIFVFAMDGGEPDADQAAAAMASVLGVPVQPAEFRGSLLLTAGAGG